MKEIRNLNILEKYIKERNRADRIAFAMLVGFMVLAIGIVYFAWENKNLNQNIEQLQEQITTQNALLSDQKEFDHFIYQENILELEDLLKETKDNYEKLSISYEKLKNENARLLQNENTSVPSNVKIISPSEIEHNKSKIDSVIRETGKEVISKSHLWTVYIQYFASKESLAKGIVKELKDKNFDVHLNSPLSFSFSSEVKYFHQKDYSTAKSIAKKYNLKIKEKPTRTKVEVPNKQIEIWLGNK